MSLSTYYMRQAVQKTADQAIHRFHVPEKLAFRVAPIAVWLVLHKVRKNSEGPFHRAGLGYALSRGQEAVWNDSRRLGAADVRARGDSLLSHVMGRYKRRAVNAICQLAKLDARSANGLLGIAAAATASALSATKRELSLDTAQTRGILISEAAYIDNTDPALLARVRAWVFRRPWWQRLLLRTLDMLRRNTATAPAPAAKKA